MTSEAKPRIAILGGGPAGSAFALSMVSRGVDPKDLVVIDKARFPRKKLCGGGVTFRGTELLRELVGKPVGGGETKGLEFLSSVGRFEVREKGPQWIHDRAELDHQLIEAVRARGVAIREGETVTAIEPAHDAIAVTTKGTKERIERFAWVIGADGANGLSRRASGLRGGIVGRLVEGVFEAKDAREQADTLYFDFDPICDRIPGYAWIFPYFVGGSLVGWKIGVMDGRGVVPGETLRAWTQRYAEERGYRLTEDKIAGFPERYWDWRTRGHREGLVLIGEAYGIDALLGEGIAPAMYSAVYAAERVKEALDRGVRTIGAYERGFAMSAEGRNLWFQARLADRIYGRHPERWLRVLFGMEHLKRLAGAGNDAYGRLLGHMPALVARYALQVVREGIPSAAPVERLPAPPRA
ncbi:MAG: NAD(P)/FAD-dependent oxidoreductase [Deltaproteobacteria bacterium]|nr:NAD(P)/FAD-dependent oxidoreductase [Deltaproteobacteria bacterium]